MKRFVAISILTLLFSMNIYASQIGSLNGDSQDVDYDTADNNTYPNNGSSSIDVLDKDNSNEQYINIIVDDGEIVEGTEEGGQDEADGTDTRDLRFSDYFKYGIQNDTSEEGYLYARINLEITGEISSKDIICWDEGLYGDYNTVNAVWQDDNHCTINLDSHRISSNGKGDYKLRFSLPDGNYTVNGVLRVVMTRDLDNIRDSFLLTEDKRSNILSTGDEREDIVYSENTIFKVTIENKEYSIPYGETILDKLPVLADKDYEAFDGYVYGDRKLESTDIAISSINVVPSYKSKMIVSGQEFNRIIKECVGDGWTDNWTKEFDECSGTWEEVSANPSGLTFYDISLEQDGSTIIFKSDCGVYFKSKYGNLILNSDSSHMFEGVEILNWIKLDNIDTGQCTDMSYMFATCKNATEIHCQNFDMNNVENAYAMFYQCYNINSLDTTNWVLNKLQNTEHMFEECTKLSTLDTSKWVCSSLINATAMFKLCDSLSVIDFSNFDSSNLQDSSLMFYSCKNITSIFLGSKFTLNNVTLSNGMFDDCSKLVNLDMSKITLANCVDSRYMFCNCTALANIDLSSLDTSNLEIAVAMFELCSNLKNITFGNKAKFQNCTDANLMFAYDENIETLDISMFDMSKSTNMYATFYAMKKLKSINFGNMSVSSCTRMDALFCDCHELTSLDLSKWDTSNVTTMESMFTRCKKLTSLNISNFNTSKVTSMSHMFCECGSLTLLDVSKFDTSNVTTLGAMFRDCQKITYLDVSKFKTGKVTDMSGMFMSCKALTSIDVSNFDLSSCNTIVLMFYYCENLTSIDVSRWNTSNLQYIAEFVQYCNKLTTIDVGKWDTHNVIGAHAAFANMPNLTSVDISRWDTRSMENASSLFGSCTSLTSLNLSNWDFRKIKNFDNMFAYSPRLTSITYGQNCIPIGGISFDYMFYNCPANRPNWSAYGQGFDTNGTFCK